MSPKTRTLVRNVPRRTTAAQTRAKPAATTVLEAPSAAEEAAPPVYDARPAVHEKAPSPTALKLRTQTDKTYDLSLPEDFQRAAQYWDYVLRNRIRWSQNPRAVKEMTDRAIELLEATGLDKAARAEIAKAGVVQIEIPYSEESKGWEYRIFPWEYVLGVATVQAQSLAAQKSSAPLIVVRHICCELSHRGEKPDPRSFMVVESAPGELNEFSFDSERRLVESNLGFNVHSGAGTVESGGDKAAPTHALQKVTCEVNPTLQQLVAAIDKGKPDLIHLAGVDTHEGSEMLGLPDTPESDGYFLADANGRPVAVAFEKLAYAIKGDRKMRGNHYPLLISCNFHNSAARVAGMLAAEGAMASIGFQDEVDNQLAETFFAQLYFNWRALGWDLLRAFRLAIDQVELGGGIAVLWSVRSLLTTTPTEELGTDTKQVEQLQKEPSILDPEKTDAREVLQVKVDFKGAVNYSLLQNEEEFFKVFAIQKLVGGKISDVCVEVKLFVGSDTFPYTRLLEIAEVTTDLTKEIRFPLTSTLLRSIRESINTVVSIKVTWKDKICYLDTKPVKLLAIDEWVDTPELDAYLPSFIFPRDRAVAKIIDIAQHYLMSLTDDSGTGFDGYQGVDPGMEDPFTNVDLQVRAIWSALSYDLPVSYINPPPTFSASSQRLRSPSDVIDGRRGTCIDLALMLAACLEYVGIYPVIFLLKDHAFPGYWRDENVRKEFIGMSPTYVTAVSPTTGAAHDGSSGAPRKPWVLTNYTEITRLVRGGALIPIETVLLTQREGFWDAVDEGVSNLRSIGEFQMMIDIQYARTNKNPVTPLPVLGVP